MPAVVAGLLAGCGVATSAPPAAAPAPAPAPAPAIAPVPTSATSPVLVLSPPDAVHAFGGPERRTAAVAIDRPATAVAATPSGAGHWLAAADGGVFTYGDAPFFGSAATLPLAAPVVGIAATPSGRGYWLAAADGGVFTFGDAPFLGSAVALPLARAVTGIASTPSGRGYWLTAADGGVLTFGDAVFLGAATGSLQHDTVTGIVPTGRGYQLMVRRFRPVQLAFTGDTLIHGAVYRQAARDGIATDRTYDFSAMLAGIAPAIAAADVAICHLEVPLSPDDTHLGTYPRFNAPHELADDLAAAGYDGCSTASNHALDAGVGGVVSTLDQLDRVGLRHAGTARTPAESTLPAVYDVGAVRIADLSYAYGFNGFSPPTDMPWLVHAIDADRILADAAAARAAGADIVVVSLHWGAEYRPPTEQQRALATQLLASADIDLLIGHHPHVVQPAEQIGDEWVVYSLGNLLSAQGSSTQPSGVRHGEIANITIDRDAAGALHARVSSLTPTFVGARYRVVITQ